MLILQIKFSFLIFFFSFSLSHFLFFIYLKYGATPLYIASLKGHEQIVNLIHYKRVN